MTTSVKIEHAGGSHPVNVLQNGMLVATLNERGEHYTQIVHSGSHLGVEEQGSPAKRENSFLFALGSNRVIKCSGETAEVIGRAEYANQPNQYWLRYCAADGRATELWWAEDALN